MREYRAKQKQAQQQLQQQIANTNTATILQNAIRNKLARKALLQEKQAQQ